MASPSTSGTATSDSGDLAAALEAELYTGRRGDDDRGGSSDPCGSVEDWAVAGVARAGRGRRRPSAPPTLRARPASAAVDACRARPYTASQPLQSHHPASQPLQSHQPVLATPGGRPSACAPRRPSARPTPAPWAAYACAAGSTSRTSIALPSSARPGRGFGGVGGRWQRTLPPPPRPPTPAALRPSTAHRYIHDGLKLSAAEAERVRCVGGGVMRVGRAGQAGGGWAGGRAAPPPPAHANPTAPPFL